MSAPDVFTDMLVGTERVLVVFGAPGPATPSGSTWWQVALTDYRLLVVRMSSRDGQTWLTEKRWAKDRPAIRITQYPRTAESIARLLIEGFPEEVMLTEVDSPDVHPHIVGFIAAWGQPIHGSQHIPLHDRPPDPVEGKADENKLILVVLGGVGFLMLCCGCGSVLAFLRESIMGLLSG